MQTPTVLITADSITIKFAGRPTSVWHKSEEGFNRIAGLVLLKSWDELSTECDPPKKAETLGMKIVGETLVETVAGRDEPAHPTRSKHLRAHPAKTLQAFERRCQKNPWTDATRQLLDFLNHVGLPLTPHGTFLGWKSIRNDYTDHHTGKTRNRPGDAPQMKREACDPNRRQACSTGYHIGTLNYAKGFRPGASRLVICKVDPSDVTSVPNDCNHEKLRCCKYKVLREVSAETPDDQARETIEEAAKTSPDKKAHTKILGPKNPSAKKTGKPGATPPSKKEVIAYALGLKKSKKGDAYAAKMIEQKFPKHGMKLVRSAITDPKNPSRLNKTQKETLAAILKNRGTNREKL